MSLKSTKPLEKGDFSPQLSVLLRLSDRCFVCDERIQGTPVHMVFGQTSYSNASFPTKIGELVGNEFLVVVFMQDVLCVRCADLLNLLDKLETDLRAVRKILTGYLATKYNIPHEELFAKFDVPPEDVSEEKVLSLQKTVMPVQKKVVPVQKKVVPLQEKVVPPHEKVAFLQETVVPLQEEVVFLQEKAVPVQEKVAHVEEEVVFLQEKGDPLQEMAVSLQENVAVLQEKAAPLHGKVAPVQEKVVPLQEKVKLKKAVKPSSKMYCCELCHFSTRDRSEVDIHMEECLKLPYPCPACPKRFTSPTSQAKHTSMAHEPKTFTCELCRSSFDSKEAVLTHLEIHPRCSICSAVCADQAQIEEHTKTKHNESDSEETCFEDAPYDSVSPPSPSRDDTEPTFLRCNYCRMTFREEAFYYEHLSTHGPTRRVRWKNGSLLKTATTNGSEETGGAASTPAEKESIGLTVPISSANGNLQLIRVIPASDVNVEVPVQTVLKTSYGVQCCVCFKTFVSTCKFEAHLDRHLASPPCKCGVCRQVLSDQGEAVSHSKLHTEKDEVPPFKRPRRTCRYCSLTFAKQKTCTAHEETHLFHSLFPCPDCDRKLKSEEELEKHKRLWHRDTCMYCGMTIENPKTLIQHERRHMKGPLPAKGHRTQDYNCPECPRVFKTGGHLRSHILWRHSGQFSQGDCKGDERDMPGTFQCKQCERVFETRRFLLNHITSFHFENLRLNRTGPPKHEVQFFECQYCHRSFKRRGGLLNHIAQHTGQYKYCCDFCGKGFMSVTFLEEHRRMHTREERFECEICGRKFTFGGAYWIHRRWHDNPRPYKCNVCHKLFKNSDVFAVHKRRHTGEKPFKCPDCSMSFTVNNSLKRHSVVHTGLYPHRCADCGKGVISRYKLAVHHAKVHGDIGPLSKYPNPNKPALSKLVRKTLMKKARENAKRSKEAVNIEDTSCSKTIESEAQEATQGLIEATNIKDTSSVVTVRLKSREDTQDTMNVKDTNDVVTVKIKSREDTQDSQEAMNIEDMNGVVTVRIDQQEDTLGSQEATNSIVLEQVLGQCGVTMTEAGRVVTCPSTYTAASVQGRVGPSLPAGACMVKMVVDDTYTAVTTVTLADVADTDQIISEAWYA